MRRIPLLLLGGLLALLPLFGTAKPEEGPELLLREHVQNFAPGTSVVAMVIDLEADGPRRQLYRYAEKGEPLPDGDSLFEIGSVTKVFTSLLLADMVRRGEVSLDTTVGEILPERQFPQAVKDISLRELSQHTSGLPRLPADPRSLLQLLRIDNPYAGFDQEDLYRALASVEVSDRGDFAYSNLGVALLGQLLAERAGRDFWPLLQDRVLSPLELADVHLDDESVGKRLLEGHRRNGMAAAAWEMGAYAPAGDLSASAESLARLVELQMTEPCPLWKACINGETGSVRLGWMESDWQGNTLVWHNGGTGGFRSFIGFIPELKRGVIVLSNGAARVGHLGGQLLGGDPEPVLRPEPRYFWILFSGFYLLLTPLGLGMYWWCHPRKTGKLALRCCRLFFASGWRLSRGVADRWECLVWLGIMGPFYVFLLFFGPWEAIPLWALWISAPISAVLFIALLIRPKARAAEPAMG